MFGVSQYLSEVVRIKIKELKVTVWSGVSKINGISIGAIRVYGKNWLLIKRTLARYLKDI